MRNRRLTETNDGADAVEGGFAQALSDVSPTAEQTEKLARRLLAGPTLTAHPTEAKRVTVLEIHRRIYRILVSLETQRWTPTERAGLLNDLEGEIDLLWLTGELRLSRPSLRDEIEWGLQFFRDAIFDAVPQVMDRFDQACLHVLGRTVDATPKIRFHSWIGGDRDGNPNVTAEMTALALQRGTRDCGRSIWSCPRSGGQQAQHQCTDPALTSAPRCKIADNHRLCAKRQSKSERTIQTSPQRYSPETNRRDV